jgi:hypothetical protein
MNVEFEMRATRRTDIVPRSVQIQGVDLDAVDHALDHGDLETVRRLLGLSRHAWRLVLARL